MKINQIVGEATGDPLGTVSTAPDASGKIKIKTPTGTEIETTKDALLPGAKPGTVQMKPDAAGDQLKPGTQVVSAEAMGDDLDALSIDSAEGFKAQLKKSLGAQGVDATQLTSIEKIVAVEPDGSVDVDQTMANMLSEFNNLMPQLLEMYAGFIKMFEDAIVSPEFKTATPEEQKSVRQSLADMKTQYPKMQKDIANAQAEFKQQQPAMQARIAAKKDATQQSPMEELGRIRELAGMKENKATQTPVKVPPIPQLPAQDGDQGDGSKLTTNPDGTKTYAGRFGRFTYNAQGKAITYAEPQFVGGLGRSIDLTTGQTTQNYNAGPMNSTQTTDAKGNVVSSNTEYDLGVGKMAMSQDAKGIKSKAYTPADGAQSISSKDMYALGDKDKESTYNRAMAQVNSTPVKESPELRAMLSIAGLR